MRGENTDMKLLFACVCVCVPPFCTHTLSLSLSLSLSHTVIHTLTLSHAHSLSLSLTSCLLVSYLSCASSSDDGAPTSSKPSSTVTRATSERNKVCHEHHAVLRCPTRASAVRQEEEKMSDGKQWHCLSVRRGGV